MIENSSKGKFFVIDGVDGSGKGTQTKILVEKLKSEGHNILEVDFPQYGKKSAALVEEYLNGKFGTAKQVTPHQASIFYACDRFEASKEMKEHLANGGIIISNRYVSSNQIHQSGKIQDKEELDKFLIWLDDLEFNIFNIPKPDKVIFLNVPFKIGQILVGKKDLRTYIEDSNKTHDIHEVDDTHMEQSYNRACSLVQRYNYWEEIKCENGTEDSIRSIEEISKEVYNLVKQNL
jgi:thymidylate kinase